jgi:hypothetical protein
VLTRVGKLPYLNYLGKVAYLDPGGLAETQDCPNSKKSMKSWAWKLELAMTD